MRKTIDQWTHFSFICFYASRLCIITTGHIPFPRRHAFGCLRYIRKEMKLWVPCSVSCLHQTTFGRFLFPLPHFCWNATFEHVNHQNQGWLESSAVATCKVLAHFVVAATTPQVLKLSSECLIFRTSTDLDHAVMCVRSILPLRCLI